MKKVHLSKEEKNILESYEKGEWKSAKNLKSEIRKHLAVAKSTLKKDRRINIRISSKDLEELQAMAAENGLPYQTLISSVLHRYVTGRLTERAKGTYSD